MPKRPEVGTAYEHGNGVLPIVERLGGCKASNAGSSGDHTPDAAAPAPAAAARN